MQHFGTDIVQARREYERAKEATNRVVEAGAKPVFTLMSERDAAQALISTVQNWNDARVLPLHTEVRKLRATVEAVRDNVREES